MAAEVHADITQIQDEDVLRRMWADTEDFGRKKEIRSHMYKLREQRLKDFYTGSTGETVSSAQQIALKQTTTHRATDSIGDQGFLTMKTKEIRDSESPTRDFSGVGGRVVVRGGTEMDRNGGYWTSRNESSYSTSHDDGAVVKTQEQLSDGQGIIRGEGYETKMALSSEGKHETLSKQDENSSLQAESISQSSRMASVTKTDAGESVSQSESKKEEKTSEKMSTSTTSSSTTKFSSSSSVSRSSQRVVTSSSTSRYETDLDHFDDVKAIAVAPSKDFESETTQTSKTVTKSHNDQFERSGRDETEVRSENIARDQSIRNQTAFNSQRGETLTDSSVLHDSTISDQSITRDQSSRNVETVNLETDARDSSNTRNREDLVQEREVIKTVLDNSDVVDSQLSSQKVFSSSRTHRESTVKTGESKHEMDVSSLQSAPIPSVPMSPAGPVTDSVNWTVVTQDNQDNEFVYSKEPKEHEPELQIPLREKPIKHPSNLDLPKEATEGQYVTTYQSHYTRPDRISVDHSPSHDYFASTLRASPDRSTPSPTKRGSRGSLDSRGSPERKLRGNSRSRSSLDRPSPERRVDRRGSSGSYTIDRKETKTETTKDSRRKFSSTQQKQVNKTRMSTPGASPSTSPSRRDASKDSDSDSDNSHATYDRTTTTTSELKTERSLLKTREKSPEYSSEGSITRELRRKGQEPSPERSAFTPIKNFRTGPEEGAITVEERKTESTKRRQVGRRDTEELQSNESVEIVENIETLNQQQVSAKETNVSRKFIEQEIVDHVKTSEKPSGSSPREDRVSSQRPTRKTTPSSSPVVQKSVSPKSSPESSPVRKQPKESSPTRKQTTAVSPTRKQPAGSSHSTKQPLDASPSRKQATDSSPTRRYTPSSSSTRKPSSPERFSPTKQMSPQRSPTRKQSTGSPERSPSSPSRDRPDRSPNQRVKSSPERVAKTGAPKPSPVRKQPSGTTLDRSLKKPAADTSKVTNRTQSSTKTTTRTTSSLRDVPKSHQSELLPTKQSTSRTITKRTSSKSITESPASQVKRSPSPVKQVQRQLSGPTKLQPSTQSTARKTTTTSTTRITQLKKPTSVASHPRTPEKVHKSPQDKVPSPKRSQVHPQSTFSAPARKAPTLSHPQKTASGRPRIPDAPTKASTVRTSITSNATRTVPSRTTKTVTTSTSKSTTQTKSSPMRKPEITKKLVEHEIDTSDLEDEQPPDEFYVELDDTVDATEIQKKNLIRITGHTVQSKKKGKRSGSPSSSSDDSDTEVKPANHRLPQSTTTTTARLTTASNQDLLNVIVQQPKSSRESSPGYPSAGHPNYTTTSDDGESNPRYADFISEPEDVEIFDTLRGPRGPIPVSKDRDQVQVTDLDEEDVSNLNVADKVSVFLEAAKNSVEPLEPVVSQRVHIESKSVSHAKNLFENISKTQTKVNDETTISPVVGKRPEETITRPTPDTESDVPVRRPSGGKKLEEPVRRPSDDRELVEPIGRSPSESERRPSFERRPSESSRRPSLPYTDETRELFDIETRQETLNQVDNTRKSVRKDTPVPKPLSAVGSNDERKRFERKISSTNVDVNSKKSLFERKIKEQAEPVVRKPKTERTESTYMKSTVASSVRTASPEKEDTPNRRSSQTGDSSRRPSKPDDDIITKRRPSKPEEITRRPGQVDQDATPTRRPSKPEDTTPWRRSSKPEEIIRRPSQSEDSSPTRRLSKTDDNTLTGRRPSKPEEITRRPSQPEDSSPTRRPSKPEDIIFRRPSGPSDSTRRPSSPRKSPPKEIVRRPSKESSPKRDEHKSPLTSRDSSASFTQESTISTSSRTTDKFGVTLRKTPSSGKVIPSTGPALSSPKSVAPGRLVGIDIEEIFDLEFLEELLVKATDYDDRRRIRAQIRLVKKQLEEEINSGKKTTTKTVVSTSTFFPSVRDLKKAGETNKAPSTMTTSQQQRSHVSILKSTTTRTDSDLSKKYPADRPRSTYSPERESSPVSTKETSPDRRTSSSRVSPERRTSSGRVSSTTTSKTTSIARDESPEKSHPQTLVQNRGEQSSKRVTTSNVVTNGDRTTYQSTVKTQSFRRVTTSSSEVKQVTGSPATTDSITSSYGVGPTDENGRPLFGLRALRRTNTNKTLDGETGETVTETTSTEYQQQSTEERRNSQLQQEIQEFLLDSEGRPLFGGLKALQASTLAGADMLAQTPQFRQLVERHQQLVAKESSSKDQQPIQKPKAKIRDSFIIQSQEEDNALRGALSHSATSEDSSNKGLTLKSIIKKHDGGEARSEMESRRTVVTSHSTISADGKVSMKKDVVRGEISAKNGEQPTGKITQSSYSYKTDSDTPCIVSTTKTTLIGGGPRRTSGPKIEEVTDGSPSDQSSRRFSKEYTVEEESSSETQRKNSSGIKEENVKAFTSILKNRDEGARRSSEQSELENKRSTFTSTKSSSVTSTSSSSAFKQAEQNDIPKKSFARGDSVKALQNKFQQATASNQQHPSRSYPKAGLILRSNSILQSDENSSLSSSLKQSNRSSTVSSGDSDRDGVKVTSSSTRTMEDSRTVKSSDGTEQRRSSSSSSTTTTSRNQQASTFLNDSSKVTGVQDILDRMRNADLVTEGSDSTEDAEARALLNKFLGASVILQSMEQGMRASTASTTTSSALVSQAEKERVKATNSNQFDDLDEITDEKQLKILLETCSDYEGQRKIRARLHEVMADSKGGTVASGNNEGTVDSKDGSSKSESTTFHKTEVRTRAVSSTAKLTKANSIQSPFAKFKQLERQNSAPSVARVARASSFTFTPSSASSIKERLLGWVQAQTRDYKNVQIDNFSTSWSNGLAFCALIHHFCPNAFDYSSLNPENRRHNFELAFRVAETEADIYPLLDVDDMVTMLKPDWKCVFTYVQSIYRRFHESPLANPTNPYLAD